MLIKLNHQLFFLVALILSLKLCCLKAQNTLGLLDNKSDKALVAIDDFKGILVKQPVKISGYFHYIDSLVSHYDSLTPYTLTEHILVRANPWIIDTLKNTDYYRMKARDSFVYNQKDLIVLREGNTINIPDSLQVNQLKNAFNKTRIDINIPEYKLRIYEDSVLLYEFPVRVGKNQSKFLKMSGRVQNLKTKTGEGHIVNHVRNPRYVNPVNNHQYFVTKRDDGEVTRLPQIPFIETEINGLRYGQLIHPTTNPITLQKAYSNGCIGTNEGDAWVIYYYAPIATKIEIRYQLMVVNKEGEPIVLEDIYGKGE